MCPYIKPEYRQMVLEGDISTPGELAYFCTWGARRFLYVRAQSEHGVGYDDFAAVVAAMETAKFTIQDNEMREYEATKRHENGDV